MTDERVQLRQGDPTPWTPTVLGLLNDWNGRAAASAETHYAIAGRLGKYNIFLGIPVVVLSTFVGTSVFATLQDNVSVNLRIMVGGISVIAAVMASLQTFLRFAERAEKHRAAAEHWAAVRREISEMLALHPDYLATQGDPKEYLDDLRRRMDEISAQSPEMGDRTWSKAQDRYELSYKASSEAPPDVPSVGTPSA